MYCHRLIGTGYRTVFWPEQGEYANTTVLHHRLTPSLSILKQESGTTYPSGDSPSLPTGIQNLVLSFSTRTVHEGFFRPLFAALRKNPENGFVDLSRHLRAPPFKR